MSWILVDDSGYCQSWLNEYAYVADGAIVHEHENEYDIGYVNVNVCECGNEYENVNDCDYVYVCENVHDNE